MEKDCNDMSLIEDLEGFFNTRQDKIYSIVDSISEEYAKEGAFIEASLNDLRDNIPVSVFKTFNQLISIQNHMEIISNLIFYKKGFYDGMKIAALALGK